MLKNIILLDSIFTKLFKVSEEILDNNIDNFILYNLKEENSFKKSHNCFYSYLNFTKEYFICHYANKDKSLNIIDLMTLHLKNKNFDNKKVLIYFEDYFLLFNHSKFYYFQKIEKELLSQDINEYIKKRFMFQIDDTYHLSSSDISTLSKEKIAKSVLFHLKDKNALKIYFSYLIILFFLGFSFVSFDYYNKTLKEKERALKLENKLKQNNIKRKDTLFYKTSLLLSEIEENKVKIKKFNFTKKSVNITIILTNSADAYSFLQKYKNIKILSYKKTKDGYEVCSEVIL